MGAAEKGHATLWLMGSPDEQRKEGSEEGHVEVSLFEVLLVHAFIVPARGYAHVHAR